MSTADGWAARLEVDGGSRRAGGLLGGVGGVGEWREVVEARGLGQLEGLEDLALAVGQFGALGDGAVAGSERDEVHTVKLVADVAPGVGGLGLGDAQQQRQPAQLDVGLDAVLAAVIDGPRSIVDFRSRQPRSAS